MDRSYYDILGVEKSATQEEIKRAYKKKAKKHHPDVGGDEERFKEIQEAYSVLSDKDNREEYDFEEKKQDIFEDLEDMFRGHGRPFSPYSRRQSFAEKRRRTGTGHVVNVNLSFEDVLSKTKVTFDDFGEVILPAGVSDGHEERLDDFYKFRVCVEGSDEYDRDGKDLYKDLDISSLEAIVGCDKVVENPYGEKLRINIPPNTQYDEVFKVDGFGIEDGNLYIRVKIYTPNLEEEDIEKIADIVNKNE